MQSRFESGAAHDDSETGQAERAVSRARARWSVRAGGRARGLLSMALAVFAFSGCADESREAEADREAQALLAEVADDYAGWATMPGFDARRASASPHGNAVEIYVNAVLDEALTAAIEADGHDASGPWPAGSIVVKDGYDGDTLITRSLLHKTPEGWFFALFDAEDAIVDAGRDIHCLDCHSDGRDRLLSLDVAWSTP